MVRGLIHSRFITVQPIKQPRPQGFSLKKWVGRHPLFKGKAPGARLPIKRP